VQALAHLGAAVVDEHRAVLVDVHECAALIEGGEVEGDAELHRSDRQASLGVLVLGVELGDLGAPFREVAGVQHLLPRRLQAGGVTHRLAIRGALPLLVEVPAAKCGGVHAQQRGAAAEDVLDDEHPLRPPEPTEGCLGRLIRLGDAAVHAHVRDPVRVVDVAEGPGQDGFGQVQAPAAVGRQSCVQRLEAAVAVEADAPAGVEAVPLAGHRHVLRAVEPEPDWPPGEQRPERGDGGIPVRLHLLAAEAAPHPQALDGDVVVLEAQDVSDDLLRLGRVLRAALDEDLSVLVHVGERAVGLEVEVLLPGELDLAAEDMRRGGQAGLDIPPLHVGLAALEVFGRDRLAHRDQRGQWLASDRDRERPPASGLDRLGQDPAHRVAVEHDLGGKERFVVLDAGVVDARDVGGGEHPDNARHAESAGGVQASDSRVRQRNLNGMRVQHVLGPRDEVIGVERLPGDVERGALMRDGDPDRGIRGSFRERAHAGTSVPGLVAYT